MVQSSLSLWRLSAFLKSRSSPILRAFHHLEPPIKHFCVHVFVLSNVCHPPTLFELQCHAYLLPCSWVSNVETSGFSKVRRCCEIESVMRGREKGLIGEVKGFTLAVLLWCRQRGSLSLASSAPSVRNKHSLFKILLHLSVITLLQVFKYM